MIKRIKVKNFKSLEDFEMKDINVFTCLIGLNGAGKTTLLQFFDFLKAILTGRVSDWFTIRKWTPQEILTAGSAKRLIEFEIDILTNGKEKIRWSARFNILEKKCTFEILIKVIDDKDTPILTYNEGKLKLGQDDKNSEPYDLNHFNYEGSILSILGKYPDGNVNSFINIFQKMKIFDVLDPQVICQSAQTRIKTKDTSVGHNGSNLIGFLSSLKNEDSYDLVSNLKDFYKPIQDYKLKKQRFGWKNLLLREVEKIYFDASHLSYGTLRLFVILSQKYSDSSFLLFDEIENGINQELVEKLIDYLQNFNEKQVVVTTHSALVLNYLTDEVAKKSVIFLYKDLKGHTHAKKFFIIPQIAEQLEFMSPGQVMSQTNLFALTKKLSEETLNTIQGE